jgi:hypothetical protein
MKVLRQKNRGFFRSPKLQGAAPDDVVAKKVFNLAIIHHRPESLQLTRLFLRDDYIPAGFCQLASRFESNAFYWLQ